MKKNFKRGLALFLAIALVASGAVYTSGTSLKATSEELEAQTEQQADGTEVNQGQAEGAVANPDAGTQASDETGEAKQEIVLDQMPAEQPAQDTAAAQEEAEAAKYDVVFHKPSAEGGSMKLWADGKDPKNVSYDGNGVYTEQFAENTLLNFQITANEQYTVDQVTDQNGVQIAPLSVDGKIYSYQIFVSANTEITALYKEVAQTNTEEPAKEEDKTSPEDTAKDANEKEENVEYTLHISHVLHTSIGNFHDEKDVKLTKEDFTDGSYNVLSQVSTKKGIVLSVDSLSVKAEDFNSSHKASVTMNYEVAKGFKAESKTGKAARSIYVGTFDDVEIVPGDQMPVTVTFTYENGTLAAPAQTIMVVEGTGGYDFSFEIPAKDGYTIGIDEKDKDTYSLNGNILSAHFSSDVNSSSVNVTYLANDATYKVDYLYQKADGSDDYDQGSSETMNGKAGELTEVQPPEKTGFTAKHVKQLEIKADGSTAVTVEYVRNTYSVSYNSNGGTYVSPVKGLFEQTVKVFGDGSATVNPVREGYTFDGWYSDEGCTTPADASVTLTENKTVYAKWNPGEADYTVVYFKQVWDNAANKGYYVYTGNSEEKKARVGDTVKEETRELPYSQYPNYKFGSSSEEVVRADGKTVVMVKYDLIEYTIEFGLTTPDGDFGDIQPDATLTVGGKVYRDREYKVKAVVGQNISNVWPDALNVKTNAPDGSFKTNFTPFAWKWQDELQGSGSTYGSTMVLKMNELRSEMLELMPGKGDPNKKTTYTFRTMYIGKAQMLEKGSVTIWLEQLDGTYIKSDKYSQEFPVQNQGDDLIQKQIRGYTMGSRPSSDYPKEDDKTERETHTYNFYYNLNTHQIEYVNGDKTTKSDSIPVTSDIKKYDTVPKHPENVGSDYTFKGWYDNALGAGAKYEFTEMPDNSIRLYAIWKAPTRDITLDYGYKTDNGKITVDNGATADIPTPEREGYLFEGWFTDKDCKTPFDYAQPIEKDMTLFAKWTENNTTTYTVRYVIEDITETDGYKDIAEKKKGTGIVGDIITEKAKLIADEDYSKYVVNKSSQALELKSAASQNEILFVYSVQKDLKYTVQYVYKEKVIEEETGIDSKANKFQVYPNEDIVKKLGNKGYALNEAFVNADLGTVEKENVITFTLSKKAYTITYEGLEGITGWTGTDGLDNPNQASYTTDDEFTLKNPVKKGFEFDGWEITSGTESGGSKHDPMNTTIEKGSSGNLVFTATWKDNSFTVKYDTNGGTPAAIDDRTDVKWTDKGLVPSSSPTRKGYNFIRWSCQETGITASADSSYADIAGNSRELKSVLLVAQWERDWSDLEVVPYEGYYDGQAHSVEVKGTVTGDQVQYTTDFSSERPVWGEKISYTDVTTENGGKYPVKVRVVSQDGQYVTKIDSYIWIKPVEIKIIADSDSKEYDGTPLTKNSYSVAGTFVDSDGIENVVVEGSRTVPGQSDNIVTSYALKNGTNADNYQIGKEKGTLTIKDRNNKLPLNIKGNDVSFKYDGTDKTLVGFETNTYTVGKATYTVEGLEAAVSGKDAYVYTQNVTGKALVRDADGNDVTSQFSVTITPGKLTIGTRSVLLTSGTSSRQYDGTPLTNHTVDVDKDGFAEGEGAEYTFTGEQTIVGNSPNTFTYTLNSNTKAGNYSITDRPGTLSILNRDAKYEITVVAKSDKVKYDGKPHSVNGFETLEFTEGTSGKKFTVSGLKAEAKGTDADTYNAVVTGTAVVKDENDKDVTSQFTVKTTAGTLKIDKREVTLTSGTKSKVYDGTPVTNSKVTVGNDGFAEGEGASYNVTGTQTAVGSSRNTFSYTLTQGTKAANYIITPVPGTLTVTSRGATYEIDVKAKSGIVEYDGETHSISGLVAEEFYVGESKYTITGLTAAAEGENAGKYAVNVTGTAVVRDANGNDVTSEFKINPVAGELKINPRLVTMESATENKFYDGIPLTNAAVTEGGSGFVAGQGATYNVTGSQTLVGYSNNTFTYTLNQGTIAENYDIKPTAGVLTVKNRDAKFDITMQAKSDTVTYDGKDHTVSGFVESKFIENGQEYTVTGLEASVTGKDVAAYTTNITGTAIVRDSKGNNVSDQFNVTPKKGTLTINQRLVTMTSATQSKDYDGTPLTDKTVTEGGKGFVEGEGVTYTVTGTRTLVGSASNDFTYQPKAGTNLANYDIRPTVGTLTVNNRNAKFSITVKGNSDTVLYDGAEHMVEGVVSKTFTENGQEFTVEGLTASATGIDARDYAVNVIGTPIVRDAEGNDVTDQFKVEVEPGILKINKRTVTLTSSNAEKEYDGTPLTNNEVTVGGDKFADGQGASFTVTGTQTTVGLSSNTFTYTLNDGTTAANYTIKPTYGTLNVKVRDAKYNILVEAKSDTVTYDGKEHKAEGFKTLEFTENGQKFTVEGLTAAAKGTNAGKYILEVTGTAIVRDSKGNDVSEQFSITPKNGELRIKERKVTLTSATQTKTYDGKALTNKNVEVSGDGFVDGQGATYKVTGSQKAVGFSDNEFEYTLTDKTKAANYIITPKFGTLTVTSRADEDKYKITVEANSGTVDYDGDEHTVEGIKQNTFTVEGETYTVEGLTASATGINAADSYDVNINGTPVVRDSDGNDVSSQFAVTPKKGALTINKRVVTLTSTGDSKVYDGTALTKDEVTIGGMGFVKEEGATWKVTGTQTLVGASLNNFTYALKAGTNPANYTITPQYGTLTVTSRDAKYEITLKAKSDTVTYDGKEHTVKGFEKQEYVVDGQTYKVDGFTAKATGINADTYTVNVTGTPIVTDAKGNDVTDQFQVHTTDGTLKINQRKVVLTSAADTKKYDGKALTNKNIEVGGEKFAEGEGATYKVTGSQRVVGFSDNEFEYTLTDKTNPANYIITPKYGLLTVTNRDAQYKITVEANSDTVDYDGDAHTVNGIKQNTFTVEGETYTVEGLTASATGINAGSYDVNINGTPVVKDSDGKDVSSQFAVTPEKGTLTINQRIVTLTSTGDSKVYDGTALTKDEVTIGGMGFVKEEGVTWKVTGTQTVVGTSSNYFTYALKAGTNPDNYTITPKYGTLTVTSRDAKYEITLEAKSDTVTYDGKEHTVSGFKKQEFVVDGQTYKVDGYTAEAAGTNADVYAVNVTGTPVVTDKKGNDVTDQFAVHTTDGTLRITKRNVTITAESAEKTYDGAPLENADSSVEPSTSTTGLVEKDTYTAIVRGSQTYVGESANKVTNVKIVKDNKADVTNNYQIIPVDGILKVKDGDVDVDKVVTKTHNTEKTYKAGDTVVFNITVTNIYNENKTITIEEQDGVTITGLAEFSDVVPGAVVTTTAAYVVTEADILNGTFKNTVKAKFSGVDKTFKNEDTVDKFEDPNGHLTVNKITTSTPKNGATYALGETISYRVEVKNDGNLTLKDVVVTDALTKGEWTVGTLAPGETSRGYTTSYVVTEEDILNGSVLNEATADGTSPDEHNPKPEVTPGQTEDGTEAPNGHLTVVKTTISTPANGTSYVLGEKITYKIVATNDGNLTLKDVKVTDELTGDEWTVGTLKPGQSSDVFETTYKVTEGDILNGSVINEAAATGKSPDQENPEAGVTPGQTEDKTDEANGHLTVVKEVTSTPENGAAYALGEEISYKIVAANDGNLTLKNVVVKDELTGDEWTVGTLKPGEKSDAFETTYKVTEGDILNGSVLNVATAAGESPDPEKPDAGVTPGEKEVPTATAKPSLFVEKTAADKDGGYELGDTISYKIKVVNNGNVTVSGITVKDDLTGEEWTIDSLAPNATQEFTTEYVVTEANLLAGQIVNVAAAQGTAPDNSDVLADGSKTVQTGETTPHLSISKEAWGTPANGTTYALGETITYKIVAKNDGNLTLRNIVVTDELTGAEWTIDSLAPGQSSQEFTTSYVVTSDDILNGSVLNVAAAAGESPDPEKPEPGVTPGEKEVTTDDPNPNLTVVKEVTSTPANGATYALGETIKYKVTVSNEGNVPVENIVVDDSLVEITQGTIASLLPGESKEFTYDYVVKDADIRNGKVVNTATASTGDETGPKGEDAVTTPTDPANADYTVNKVVVNPQTQYEIGDTIQYKIEVSNTGNLILNNVVVTDNLQGASGKVVFTDVGKNTVKGNKVTILEMAPGETVVLNCRYEIVREDAGANISNIANVITEETGETPREDITEEIPVVNEYTLTINYRYAAGGTAAPTYIGTYTVGQQFGVTSPTVASYEMDIASISSNADGMPAQNLEFTVTYIPRPAVTPNVPTNPTAPGTPENRVLVEVPTILAPAANTVAAPDENGDYVLTPVADEDTPLANMNLDDHACCVLHFLLMLLALILLIFYTSSMKKRQARIFELDEKLRIEKAKRGLDQGKKDVK